MNIKLPPLINVLASVFCLSWDMNPTFAQEAAAAYHERYALVGELVRATAVCAHNKKEIKWYFAGLAVIESPELRAFSGAFPQKMKEWMEDGSKTLNDKVMSDGIPAACAFAKEERERALRLAKEPIEAQSGSNKNTDDSEAEEYTVSYKGTCKFKFLNRDSFAPCELNRCVYKLQKSSKFV